MHAKILVLGAYGLAGKKLSPLLLAHTDADIVVAGRSLEKAQSFAAMLNETFACQRVSACQVDAAQAASLRKALQGINLLLVSAPVTQHATTVIQTAIEAGVDYLDIQLDTAKTELLKSLSGEIERSGACFITEAGFHPGLPAAMVRFAATRFDVLETAKVACFLNMGKTLPYSEAVDELITVFKNYQAQVYKNGQWTAPGSYEIKKISFGKQVQDRMCFSMFFEELRNLPTMIPSLKNLGFYMSGTHWMVDWIITPLVFLGIKIAPIKSIRLLGKFLWWGMQHFANPPYIILLKIEAEGLHQGLPKHIEIQVEHPDGYDLTAIPVVACLKQYLDGTAKRSGLWMMGQLVEPLRFFQDLQHMDVQVRIFGES